MTNSLPELIIKVGNKSVLSFSHSKAYRVVTYDELVTTSRILSDCHLIIIEGINSDEYNGVRDFVKSFIDKDEANKVWIYSENTGDETINGLIDELGFDIFETQDELFKDIFDKTNLNISTNTKLRKTLNELNAPKEADDPFSAFTFTSIEEDKPVDKELVKKTDDTIPSVSISIDKLKKTDVDEPVSIVEETKVEEVEQEIVQEEQKEENITFELPTKTDGKLEDTKTKVTNVSTETLDNNRYTENVKDRALDTEIETLRI